MLSKLTTQSVGTRSSCTVRSSSDASPRRVRVRAATTTAPVRSATGSRVNTRTGRAPPGVAANQISPRCIPVGPVFGRPPVGDLGERPLAVFEGSSLPGRRVHFAGQTLDVAPERLPQQFGAVQPQAIGPPLRLPGFGVV